MGEYLTLGRGEIHFAQFKAGTQIPRGARYLGNTPEFNLSASQQALDHFSSDRGIRQKDNSIPIQVDRTGSIVTDEISPDNLAIFFGGDHATLSVVGATVTGEALADVEKGLSYQLGKSNNLPAGARDLDVHTAGPPAKKVIVKKGATELVEGTDYEIDMMQARITILTGGSIVDGDDLTVDYKTKTGTREMVVSGDKAIEGEIYYIAYNPAGKQVDYYLPWVKLTPNGDFSLKSGEDWAQLPFNVEVLKLPGRESVYANGRPVG